MPLQPIPLRPEDLPEGWHIFRDGRFLGMLGANVSLLNVPDPALRLRGPEWTVILTWSNPTNAGPGIEVYDVPHQVIADVDGPGFWEALRQTLTDWVDQRMPDALRARLLAEIGPRADRETYAYHLQNARD